MLKNAFFFWKKLQKSLQTITLLLPSIVTALSSVFITLKAFITYYLGKTKVPTQ